MNCPFIAVPITWPAGLNELLDSDFICLLHTNSITINIVLSRQISGFHLPDIIEKKKKVSSGEKSNSSKVKGSIYIKAEMKEAKVGIPNPSGMQAEEEEGVHFSTLSLRVQQACSMAVRSEAGGGQAESARWAR